MTFVSTICEPLWDKLVLYGGGGFFYPFISEFVELLLLRLYLFLTTPSDGEGSVVVKPMWMFSLHIAGLLPTASVLPCIYKLVVSLTKTLSFHCFF